MGSPVDGGDRCDYARAMFLIPSGWGEVLEFVIQPAHLPIALAAGAMVFFTWRSLSASR